MVVEDLSFTKPGKGGVLELTDTEIEGSTGVKCDIYVKQTVHHSHLQVDFKL